MSLTTLSERVGVTIANLSILKTGKAWAVRFSTLDALCRVSHASPVKSWHSTRTRCRPRATKELNKGTGRPAATANGSVTPGCLTRLIPLERLRATQWDEDNEHI